VIRDCIFYETKAANHRVQWTVTRAIVQAGKLLDVEVLDHIVIGQRKWVSLKERGLGFV